jgi:hypothetical protein
MWILLLDDVDRGLYCGADVSEAFTAFVFETRLRNINVTSQQQKNFYFHFSSM